MATAPKAEFPPLFPAGLYPHTADELRQVVVTAFPLSKTRAPLWKNLEWLIGELRRLWIPCTLWIDGSYLTQKIDPDDVDVVIDVQVDMLTNSSQEQAKLLEDLAFMKYHPPPMKLHTFIMFDAPLTHPLRTSSVAMHRSWENDFGLSFIKKEPKGIATLEVVP